MNGKKSNCYFTTSFQINLCLQHNFNQIPAGCVVEIKQQDYAYEKVKQMQKVFKIERETWG